MLKDVRNIGFMFTKWFEWRGRKLERAEGMVCLRKRR
jgi:hypothetical protein